MKDFEVYELETAEEIDAAFAKTFSMERCEWAQTYDQNAVTHFLEGFRADRTVSWWSIKRRNTRSASTYEAVVSNEHTYYRSRVMHMAGVKGYAFSDYACHALMKAAIEWDQHRRERKREVMAVKRSKARAS